LIKELNQVRIIFLIFELIGEFADTADS